MGFMSKLGRDLMQQLRSRFSVQGVVFGERPAECDMAEDAVEEWQEMSECKAVNAEEASAAAVEGNMGNILDALADVAQSHNPLASGRSEHSATDSSVLSVLQDAEQHGDGESAVSFDDVDEVEEVEDVAVW